MLAGELARADFARVGGRPFRRLVGLEIVEVVFEELIERCAGDVGQLDLGLAGGAARRAALGDVLLAATGGLGHLVDGAVAVGGQEAAAEEHRALVDRLALAVGDQVPVAAVRQNDLRRRRFGHSHKRSPPSV